MLHRDDVPMDVVESLLAAMRAKYPGAKIVFAGDSPDTPESVKAISAAINRDMKASLTKGSCWRCGDTMPGYNIDTDDDDAWVPPTGWGILYSMADTPMAWECPACAAAIETETIDLDEPEKQGT